MDGIIRESINTYLRENLMGTVPQQDDYTFSDDYDPTQVHDDINDPFRYMDDDEARQYVDSWDADTQNDLNYGIDAYDPL